MSKVGNGIETGQAGRSNIDRGIATSNKTSGKAGTITDNLTSDREYYDDKHINYHNTALQQPPTSHPTPLYREEPDDQRCNLQPPGSLSVSPRPPKEKHALPQSTLPFTIHKFIITGAKISKTTNQCHQKLAQHWLLQANERLKGIREIRLENVQVDGKTIHRKDNHGDIKAYNSQDKEPYPESISWLEFNRNGV